jgi:hypothetical protein
VWNEGLQPLMLDGGDLFGRRSRQEQLETEFLCEQTAAFGTDAIGFGEFDLNYGLPFLRKMIDTYKLPFTCANVRDGKTGKLILPEFLVVTKNGIRFGIVSVLDPDNKIITMNPDEGEFRVDDPATTLRQVLPRLRGLCDTVVLIAHTGDASAETLLAKVSGIDILLLGHTSRYLETKQITRDALVIGSSFEGRYVGRADLTVDPANGNVLTAKIAITGLDATLADDPTMAAKLAAFKTSFNQAQASQRAKFPRDQGSKTEVFLGAVNCRTCHDTVYKTWHDSPHSRAQDALRPQNMENEPQCLACHTTGFRFYGGYDEQGDTRHLANVQCEACHGYGTLHARDGQWVAQARGACVQCHEEAKRPCADQTKGHTFDYAAYWAKIKH